MLRRKWWLDFPGEWTCSYAIGAGRGCGLCCSNGCIMLYRNIWIVVFCVHSFRPHYGYLACEIDATMESRTIPSNLSSKTRARYHSRSTTSV